MDLQRDGPDVIRCPAAWSDARGRPSGGTPEIMVDPELVRRSGPSGHHFHTRRRWPAPRPGGDKCLVTGSAHRTLKTWAVWLAWRVGNRTVVTQGLPRCRTCYEAAWRGHFSTTGIHRQKWALSLIWSEHLQCSPTNAHDAVSGNTGREAFWNPNPIPHLDGGGSRRANGQREHGMTIQPGWGGDPSSGLLHRHRAFTGTLLTLVGNRLV